MSNSCGTCRLYGRNYYAHETRAELWATDCVADVKMDLPASWKSEAGMQPTDGKDCPIWEVNEDD